ncbi:MAG: hypothetical protein ACRDYW_11750 [Acidimicrobiales bacterium]
MVQRLVPVSPWRPSEGLARQGPEAFGEAHPQGWVWITDLRRLIWTSPRSFLHVRRIRRLPGNRGYVVVARQPFRLFGAIAGRAFGAERFVARPEQALEFAASRL